MDVYATHLHPLVEMALQTELEGPILELGCGDYSTPVLSAIARHQRRELHIHAGDANWLHRFAEYGDIVHVPDWEKWQAPKAPAKDGMWGMVFVDSEQSTLGRIERIPQVRAVTRLVVLHDAQGAVQRPRWPVITKGWEVELRKRYPNWTAVLRRVD
jgi:hypothetical protein